MIETIETISTKHEGYRFSPRQALTSLVPVWERGLSYEKCVVSSEVIQRWWPVLSGATGMLHQDALLSAQKRWEPRSFEWNELGPDTGGARLMQGTDGDVWARVFVLGEGQRSGFCIHGADHPSRSLSGLDIFILEKGSRLDLAQSWIWNAPEAVYGLRQWFLLEEDSELHVSGILLGAAKGQWKVRVDLNGRGSKVDSRWAYKGQGSAHGDLWVDVHHQARATVSSLEHLAVVKDRSKSVFNGTVIIPQTSPGCDAVQKSRNLLFDLQAEAIALPKLEISTDDVKCSHGATVSSISEDQLYYLQSRGIDRDVAMGMILDGLVDPFLASWPSDHVKEVLKQSWTGRVDGVASQEEEMS